MPQTIFVTGATGFIGRYLLPVLIQHNYHIVALVHKTRNLQSTDQITVKEGDITKEQDMIMASRNCDLVIHLAAATDVSQLKVNYETNVVGVKNIIAACNHNNIKRVIFFSSHCAIRQNRDAYGNTKRQGEQLFAQTNLDYTILRPNMICGCGSKEFSTFVNLIYDLPIVPMIGNGGNLFQPSYIGDIGALVVHILKNPKSIGKYYEIGGKEQITADHLVHLIAKSLKRKRYILHIPLFICLWGAKILGFFTRNTIVSVDQVLAFSQDNIVDIDPICSELDYQPMAIADFLEEILENWER